MEEPAFWVCQCCGRHAAELLGLRDESCVLHAVYAVRATAEETAKYGYEWVAIPEREGARGHVNDDLELARAVGAARKRVR